MRRDFIKSVDGWYRVVYCGICDRPELVGPPGEWKVRFVLLEWVACQGCNARIGERHIKGTNLQVKDLT